MEERKQMLNQVILVFKNIPDEFPILKIYAKYGAEAFDSMVDLEETKSTIYFKKRKEKHYGKQ